MGSTEKKVLPHTQTKTHWIKLHEDPVLNYERWDVSSAKSRYKEWERNLPCRTCSGKWKETPFSAESMCLPCPIESFRARWEAHNYISRNHVDPPLPEMSLEEAEGLYDAPWIKPDGGVAFVTLGRNETVKRWAGQVGADYVPLEGSFNKIFPEANKYRVRSISRRYKTTVFVGDGANINEDATAESILELISLSNEHHVSAFPCAKTEGEEIRSVALSQNLELPQSPIAIDGNSIIVFSSKGGESYAPPELPAPPLENLNGIWLSLNEEVHHISSEVKKSLLKEE